MQEDIFGKTFNEIEDIVSLHQFPAFTAKQISHWLYQKQISSFSAMTNLPKSAREKLSNKYVIGITPPVREQLSKDGTKKYLFAVQQNQYVETVYIPEKNRKTLCISTQIGCKMGCVFCMTGRQGFLGNLSPGEILNQIVSVPEAGNITNLVLMGMGEPMDNINNVLKALEILTASTGFSISPSRITVSTIGLIPGMQKFISGNKCHLAISLNSPFEEERLGLMPVEKAYPIRDVISFLRQQSFERQRRISFEYIMFRNLNDTARHVNGISRLLNGIRCRINLIRYHALPGVKLEPSDESTVQWFRNRLNEKGILTTVRESRGQDIMAACGLLSTNR